MAAPQPRARFPTLRAQSPQCSKCRDFLFPPKRSPLYANAAKSGRTPFPKSRECRMRRSLENPAARVPSLEKASNSSSQKLTKKTKIRNSLLRFVLSIGSGRINAEECTILLELFSRYLLQL